MSIKFLFLLFPVSLSFVLRSQQKENHYNIKFFSVTTENISNLKSVLSSVTGANSINVNPKDSVFTISTYRLLNKKVVAGKMQKNYYPVKFIINPETDFEPFPVMKHTGDPDADALLYEKEKKAWVVQYPEEYKKMLEKK